MVFILLPVGVVMTSDLVQPWSDTLFVLHKGLGTVLLGVVAARFLWMLVRPGPDGPLPAGSPPAQRRLASLTHGTLYAVLLLQGGSGYVRTVGDGYPVELLDALGLPTLLPEMPGVASVMLLVHRLTAFLLTGLVAAHVAAVVQHTVVQRHGVIRRMWPPVRTRGD
jgi:cytochrome b561